MEKNNNIKIMGIFATVLLLVIVITASFAYFGSFNVNLNNNVAVNVNSVSPGDATFTSNATQLNLQVPAANMSQTVADNETPAASNTATLTVNLTGAKDLLTTCTYDIVYEYDADSYIYGGSQTKSVAKNSDKEITLQVSNVNGTNDFATEKNFDYVSNWSGLKRTLVSGATIESDGTITTQNINITAKYYNLTISQSSLEGKAFTGKIYVTNNSCKVEKSSSMSITTLMSTSTADVYEENGFRFEGANPNNYICLDNKKSGSCSDSSLLFRIIGLFEEEYSSDGTNSSGTKKLLKLIDTNNYGGSTGIAWNDGTVTSVNDQNTIQSNPTFLNTKTKYRVELTIPAKGGTSNNWQNSSLKSLLNEGYISNLTSKESINQKFQNAIVNANWYLGGPSYSSYSSLTTSEIYIVEKDASSIYSGNPSSIFAKVGLMYLSDYGYATVGGSTTNKSTCRSTPIVNFNGPSVSDCKNNSWLFNSAVFVNYREWLLSPGTINETTVANINYDGSISVYDSTADFLSSARPTFYLDAVAIKIVGGTGTSTDPYHIG